MSIIEEHSIQVVVGAGRRAAEALAAANSGLNPRNAAARADVALAVAEIADFLERNADALHALQGGGAGARNALADDATRVCTESILAIDQFAELDADVITNLRDLYADFVDSLLAFPSADAAQIALPNLIETHRRRMATILGGVDGLLPPPSVARREAVTCAEYSSTLQAEILGLEEDEVRGPALDIGCGRHARLVRLLRSRGITAYGIERFNLSSEAIADGLAADSIVATDWNSYVFRPATWGTVLSHLAFSNHFVRHAVRAEGRDIAYAKKYREILESLVVGGTFRYAPSLPFIEKHLDRAKYRVRIRAIGPKDFPFTATVVRRLPDPEWLHGDQP
jgi:hypothetical protein